MDINQIAEYLNKWQGGEILLFLVGCYTVFKKGYDVIHKVVTWYRGRVTEDINKEERLTGILSDITTIKKEMDDLSNDFNAYKHMVDQRMTDNMESADNANESVNKSFDDLEKSIREISPKLQLMEQRIEKLERQIGDLLRSDVDYIKAYITDAYNKYVKEEQHIDLLTLQNVESVYNRLLEETGSEDEFLSKLMRDLRNLPTTKQE
jgi:chromosome segregation ATPase